MLKFFSFNQWTYGYLDNYLFNFGHNDIGFNIYNSMSTTSFNPVSFGEREFSSLKYLGRPDNWFENFDYRQSIINYFSNKLGCNTMTLAQISDRYPDVYTAISQAAKSNPYKGFAEGNVTQRNINSIRVMSDIKSISPFIGKEDLGALLAYDQRYQDKVNSSPFWQWIDKANKWGNKSNLPDLLYSSIVYGCYGSAMYYKYNIDRQIKDKLIYSLNHFPAVGLLGPRQVGKTTLAKTIQTAVNKQTIYIDLELPSDYNKLTEPELFLTRYTDQLVIIDEIQKLPEIFPVLRALIDKNRIPGRYLILGSASPDLLKQSSETLAGRIIYHELMPFNLQEIGNEKANINHLWLRGGYPDSYLAIDNYLSFTWRDSFIKTYLERDIPQLGIRIPSIQLRKFWTMIAHSQGQLWNGLQIANSLGISAPTIRKYLEILMDTFIVRQLQPYQPNIKKRLTKSPKVYIRDSGLFHALLNIMDLFQLEGNPLIGNSWECFVIEQIIMMSSYTEYFFYRTNAGAKIDLIVFDSKNTPIAIEIKYSLSPKLSKGFYQACEDIGIKQGIIIYPGDDEYLLNEKVSVLPLNRFLGQIRNR